MSQETPRFLIRYLPLIIKLRCCQEAHLPAFLGSTLHGIVGWALTANTEAYSYLFQNRKYGGAKQDIVNPYIIEPPRPRVVYRPGDELIFKLILLGDAVRYANDVIAALADRQQFGLGAERQRFVLSGVLQADSYQYLWQESGSGIATASSLELKDDVASSANWCSIHLVTPLRIRRGGKLVTAIDFATVMRSITRRVHALAERYGGYADEEQLRHVLELATQVEVTSSDFVVRQLNRYSSKRQEQMDMSGIMGVMTCRGELTPFMSWLHAARVLHIGRNVTFGFGQVDVTVG